MLHKKSKNLKIRDFIEGAKVKLSTAWWKCLQ